MGQPGSVGAVVKEIQERELHPVGVFLGALHWLFCVVSVYDWLMSLVTKFTRTLGAAGASGKRPGCWGPGRGGLVEVQHSVMIWTVMKPV